MAFCSNCGAPLQDDAQFCTACGAPAAAPVQPPQPEPPQPSYAQPTYTQPFSAPNNTADTPTDFDPQDVQQNKVMAVLSYFGILVLVPLFAAKDSKFARFHANQGLVLLIAEVALSTVLSTLRSILTAISVHLSFVTSILSLTYILLGVLSILGIVNAAGGKAKELPIVRNFGFLK